jgi:hypothetical protein
MGWTFVSQGALLLLLVLHICRCEPSENINVDSGAIPLMSHSDYVLENGRIISVPVSVALDDR